MGGSSSGRRSGYSFDSVKARLIMRSEIERLESDLAFQKYEIDVAEAISDALKEVNARDVEKTNEQLEAIKDALQSSIEGTIDLLFGGSVAKHTHVDGLSDIDTLLVLNQTELSDNTPDEVRSYLASVLRKKLPEAS